MEFERRPRAGSKRKVSPCAALSYAVDRMTVQFKIWVLLHGPTRLGNPHFVFVALLALDGVILNIRGVLEREFRGCCVLRHILQFRVQQRVTNGLEPLTPVITVHAISVLRAGIMDNGRGDAMVYERGRAVNGHVRIDCWGRKELEPTIYAMSSNL